MKKLCLAMLLSCSLLAGCTVYPETSEITKSNFRVELCFEKDGYKVYRFTDGNTGYHYYVTPVGTVSNHIRNGKTYKIEEIPTVSHE